MKILRSRRPLGGFKTFLCSRSTREIKFCPLIDGNAFSVVRTLVHCTVRTVRVGTRGTRTPSLPIGGSPKLSLLLLSFLFDVKTGQESSLSKLFPLLLEARLTLAAGEGRKERPFNSLSLGRFWKIEAGGFQNND